MDITRRLYFSHIPKTGGTSVSLQLHQLLSDNSLAFYPPTPPPHSDVSNEYLFIQGHLGRYPLDKVDNLDVACLLRDPLDRAISYFLFNYGRGLGSLDAYTQIENFIDKVRYHLFDDPDFIMHKNLQSQFICSSPKENLFKDLGSHDDRLGRGVWNLDRGPITFNLAKQYVDEFAIVGITEQHDSFMRNIKTWFFNNYNIPITNYPFNKVANASSVTYKDVLYTTALVKAMLSTEDIEKFLENNVIDFELYEYVHNKIQG